MNVVSLFNGLSGTSLALDVCKIKVKNMFISEIDKYANIVTMANYPNSIQLGDVRNIDCSKLPKIDLLCGGSPCQSFSFAGKRKGMSTKCEFEIYTLSKYLELKQQNFEFEGQSYLFWEYMRILTDIRKINPNVKFLLENVEMGSKWERILSEAIGVFGVHINSSLVSAQNRKRIYWTNIRTKKVGLFGELYSDIPQPKDLNIKLKDILEVEVDEKYYLSEKMIKCLQSHEKFNKYTTETLFSENKSSCITSRLAKMGNSDTYIKFAIEIKSVIRRLTPVECERLQTVPDNYTNYVSDIQRYKMLGNGWTIDVIAHIFSFIK